MKKSLLLIITLLSAVAQGSWGQTRVNNESELAQAVKTDGANIIMQADIVLSQAITIQGDNGAAVSVTINMNGKELTDKTTVGQTTAACVFIVPSGSELNLSNGTIADVSNITGNNTKYIAGAIVNDGTATLSSVTISGCKGLLGGAVKNNKGAKLNLNTCTFDGNEATTKKDYDSGKGGAVWNEGSVVLFDTKFQDCQAVNGAAIYNEASGSISMGENNSTTSFYSNKASGDGGAIYNLGTLNIQATTFSTNIASDQAGAIWNIGILSLKGCDFLLNQGNTAGALYIAPNGKGNVSLTGGSFKQNKASTDGGAIYSEFKMSLDAVTFENNKALAGNGGAFYVSTTGDVTVTDANSIGNAYKSNTASANGGTFYTIGKLTLAGANATGNSADKGGFLYIDANGSALINTNTSITENTATTLGGAIYDAGTLSMQGKISVKNNTAADSQKNNVYLASGKVITVAGAFNSSGIGISLEDVTGTFTSGYSTSNSGTAPDKVFSSDYMSQYYSVQPSGNEAKIDLQSPIYVKDDSGLREVLKLFDNVSVQLSNDIKLSNSTLEIPGGKTITLNLGGFTLDRGLKAREWNTGGQVITVRKDATLNLSNGTLTGGWGGDSGGLVNEGGTANLKDVTITGCTGDDRAGGISNNGTLTMTGGAITDNTSRDKMAPRGGGGLFNKEGATATLTGVTITGNKTAEYGGGGISNHGTLTIDGCTITGNTVGGQGGAIWTNGTLNMQGKNTVTDNIRNDALTDNVFLTKDAVITVTGSLAESKIGVTLENITGTFTSGYKKNNSGVDPATLFTADKDNLFDVVISGDEAALTPQKLMIVDNNADLHTVIQFDGANIQLANDIKTNDVLKIVNNRTVTIDLNGKTLNRGLSSLATGHGQVFAIASGSTFNLSNGTITGGFGGDGGGLLNEGGTVTLTDVNITGNHANDRGGGISNHGTLTMTGGSITNNTSNDDDYLTSIGGGGIFAYGGSTTTLSGVTITGNQAKIVGGGGINNFGTLTLDGCTITGNTSKHNGGGIWNGGGSKLSMQGANTVTDNDGLDNADNVYLTNGIVIAVTGSLAGSQIGISMQTPDVFTSGFGANNDKAPLTYFLSDISNYTVVASGNEAKLVKDMETVIDSIEQPALDGQRDSWYDLNGRRLEMKPATKGVYINNGKKVVIK
jgi:predicted outer membrane repeat protein